MLQRTRGFTLRIAVGLATVFLWGASGFVSAALAQQPPAQQPLVDKFVLKDTVQPVSQSELTRAIDRANSDGAQALLIDIDTPGGLLESMRAMIAAMLASRVPVRPAWRQPDR